ncbi:MAG: CDP-glucose 4,6-dehydratase [Bacteroidales bacterium]|nr:CDP-glucose 4,6-dehydratase [Bacteroidales bacterium]
MVTDKTKTLPSSEFWAGKRVLVTGHTGFKGSWLTLYLGGMGVEVYGLALDPLTNPNLFTAANVAKFLEADVRVDIRDESAVCDVFAKIKPEIVFHMAAQPLVRASYQEASYTFAVNSLGTAHILEAIRNTPSVRTGVMITTDKVYKNCESVHPYCENDALGGNDPYSASKACAEIIINSYRRSFLEKQNISISSVRAGNVIGGGDWSEDRLIPDAIKSFISGKTLLLRNPEAIRPWQHVLDVLSGYLLLAQAQWSEPKKFARAWNFAPEANDATTVKDVAKLISELWGEGATVKFAPKTDDLPEAGLLMLDSAQARTNLGWRSKWSLLRALQKTVKWYKAWQNKNNMHDYSLKQIKNYISAGDNDE